MAYLRINNPYAMKMINYRMGNDKTSICSMNIYLAADMRADLSLLATAKATSDKIGCVLPYNTVLYFFYIKHAKNKLLNLNCFMFMITTLSNTHLRSHFEGYANGNLFFFIFSSL